MSASRSGTSSVSAAMNKRRSELLGKIAKVGGGGVLAAAVAVGVAANSRKPSKSAVILDSVSSSATVSSASEIYSAAEFVSLPAPETSVTASAPAQEISEAASAADNSSEAPNASERPQAALININTATSEELQQLKGIGAAKAAAVIEYREQHGGFSDISEIKNVSGIGEKIFENISGSITTGTSAPPSAPAPDAPPQSAAALININTATSEELQRLPGIGEAKAAAVIEYREQHGGFSDISEIKNVSGIGEKIFGKIQSQITV